MRKSCAGEEVEEKRMVKPLQRQCLCQLAHLDHIDLIFINLIYAF